MVNWKYYKLDKHSQDKVWTHYSAFLCFVFGLVGNFMTLDELSASLRLCCVTTRGASSLT